MKMGMRRKRGVEKQRGKEAWASDGLSVCQTCPCLDAPAVIPPFLPNKRVISQTNEISRVFFPGVVR